MTERGTWDRLDAELADTMQAERLRQKAKEMPRTELVDDLMPLTAHGRPAAADYEDATYLGMVLRIRTTNVTVYTRNGTLLANLLSVGDARAFVRDHRRLYGSPPVD